MGCWSFNPSQLISLLTETPNYYVVIAIFIINILYDEVNFRVDLLTHLPEGWHYSCLCPSHLGFSLDLEYLLLH